MSKDFENENEILKNENYIEYDIENLDEDEEFKEIILTLEDDTELSCLVVAQYQVEDQDYIALLPIDEEEAGDILLYKVKYGDDESFDVSMIEDEEEFDIAADAYYRYLDEKEIDLEDLHHNHDNGHNNHNHFDSYEDDYYDKEYDEGFEVNYLDDELENNQN